MKFKVIVQAGSVYNHSNYDLEREILDPIGAELIEVKSDNKNDFIKEAKNADALIAGKMQLSKEIIESLNSIDVKAIVPTEDWELLGPQNSFPNGLKLSHETVSIPIYPSLTNNELDHILSGIIKK